MRTKEKLVAMYEALSNESPELWQPYIDARLVYDGRTKKHPLWPEFVRWCQPLYELFETRWGWTEIARTITSRTETEDEEWWVYWSTELNDDFPSQAVYSRKMEQNFSTHRWVYAASSLLVEFADPPEQDGIYDSHRSMHHRLWRAYYRGESEFSVDEMYAEFINQGLVGAEDLSWLLTYLVADNTYAATHKRVSNARDVAVSRYKPEIERANEKGIVGLRPIARYLTHAHVPTPTGKSKWNPSNVKSILKVMDDAEQSA